MTTLNTSRERVAALTYVSDQIYPILEEQVGGEMRARRIVRLGIASIAIALRDGATLSQAGTQFDQHLAYELRNVDYGAYEQYRTPAKALPDFTVPGDLAKLANAYSDTLRGTHLADLSREPDSVHALHLTALAVPYARAHYPAIDDGKAAAYGLTHDLTEVVFGDTETFNIPQEKIDQKKQDDAEACRILRVRHGRQWPGLIDTVDAYESLDDDEAAYIKTKDKNDPGYTHFRNNAYALKVRHNVQSVDAFYECANINTLRTLGYASRFALVLKDKDILNERIARLLSQT